MLRVLLVDDEPFIVQGLAVLIDWEKEGYEITSTAADGARALEYLKENEVDLIIADIKMPVMTGIELLEKIRSEKISRAYFIILSGYNDFRYAQQAIRYECMEYLLKPIGQEELILVLHKVSSLHESRQLERRENRQKEKAYLARNVLSLLMGKFDQMDLDYVRKSLKLSNGVRFIDIEIDELEDQDPEEELSDENKRCYRELYQRCMDYLGEEYSSHCIFDVANHEKGYDIGFLYFSRMAKEQGISETEYMERFLAAIEKNLEVPVVMFVGSLENDITEIERSYRTAAITKSFQFFRASKSIHYYEEENIKNPTGAVLCKKFLDQLVNEIEENNREEIGKTVDRFYEEMSQMGMDAGVISLNINYLLFQLIHLAAEQDSTVNQEKIMHQISGGSFDGRMLRGSAGHLKQFADDYADYLMQLRKNVSRGVLADIEKEVKEHYAENLTLKNLSKKYYVNSAYLGQIFRKKYNMTFKEYQNNYRMEQASLLLIRTDKRVYEIAEEMGYKNLDYFISRFIAVKGCTPAKYRKNTRDSQKNS